MPMFNGRPVTPGQFVALSELTRDLKRSTKEFVIVQRSEDGTGYYTGGRFGGWAFDLKDAKRYTTKKIARRKAREINKVDKEYGAHIGTATVREV